MKKLLLVFGFLALLTVCVTSCNTERDCRGVKHTRLANGVRI